MGDAMRTGGEVRIKSVDAQKTDFFVPIRSCTRKGRCHAGGDYKTHHEEVTRCPTGRLY